MSGRIPCEKNFCLMPVCFRKDLGRCNDILPLHSSHFHRNLQIAALLGGGDFRSRLFRLSVGCLCPAGASRPGAGQAVDQHRLRSSRIAGLETHHPDYANAGVLRTTLLRDQRSGGYPQIHDPRPRPGDADSLTRRHTFLKETAKNAEGLKAAPAIFAGAAHLPHY